MNSTDVLAAEFQAHRAHLQAVSYRMLGSLAEADDAVQETWLRLTSTGTDDVRNLRAPRTPSACSTRCARTIIVGWRVAN